MKKIIRIILSFSFLAMIFVTSCEKESNSNPSSSNDTEPPTITITSPASGASLSGIQTVSVSSTDNEGVSLITILVDTVVVGVQVFSSPQQNQSYSFDIDFSQLENGEHLLYALASDEADNYAGVYIPISIGDEFVSKFVNTTFTDITINVDGFSQQVISSGDSLNFNFSGNPGSYSYTAFTKGETNSGSQVGLELNWSFTHNVNGLDSKRTNLVVSDDYFYALIQNETEYAFNRFVVNYGTSNEVDNPIDTYYDDNIHGMGYYLAVEEANTRAYYYYHPEWDYAVWAPYYPYLPFEYNQYILFTCEEDKNGNNLGAIKSNTNFVEIEIFSAKDSDLSIR